MAVAGEAFASQLRVEPILLELNAPAAAGTLILRNDEDADIIVQTRVFRWSQVDGQEILVPTTDVVASPPQVRLASYANYTVRIVRTSKQPVQGEESYRIVVDQLPRTEHQTQVSVRFLLRQLIPVFFRAPQLTPAKVSWSLTREHDTIVATASNAGDERLRIASLSLRDGGGSNVGFGNGLVGYVLGRSSMSFVVTKVPPKFGAAGPVRIDAVSNVGPISAAAPLQLRR
jgi:fimbrial chaperone protein